MPGVVGGASGAAVEIPAHVGEDDGVAMRLKPALVDDGWEHAATIRSALVNLLIVPGIYDSGPAHWQTLWEREHGGHRFRPASFDEPDAWDWVAAIEREAADLGPDTLVIAHSLGCLATAHVAATSPPFRGVVLVAPPDLADTNFPVDARRFEELTAAPLRVPGLLLYSSDDHYSTPASTQRMASAWGVPGIDLGRLGHVNAESGLGGWDEGWRLVTAFRAGFGAPAHS
jgi:predicted alpha/beta hydrolase family esterase